MTAGRTAGELPEGVPKSGRGGMKGVAGSESSMMNESLIFPRVELLSHTNWRQKIKSGNDWTHEERTIFAEALVGFDPELRRERFGSGERKDKIW